MYTNVWYMISYLITRSFLNLDFLLKRDCFFNFGGPKMAFFQTKTLQVLVHSGSVDIMAIRVVEF